MLKKVAFLAVAGAALASNGALAAQVQTPMNVSATITSSCSITATPMAFPTNITSTSSPINFDTATVTVNCSSGVPYTVGMDNGQNAGGPVSRQMASGANRLFYSVYTDTGHTTALTNIGGGNTIPGTGSGANQVLPVYGQIITQTTPLSGAYADQLTVTVNY